MLGLPPSWCVMATKAEVQPPDHPPDFMTHTTHLQPVPSPSTFTPPLLAHTQARDAAKAPPTAYAIFTKEQYAKLGGSMKVQEASKHIAALWKAMPEADKQRRKEVADAARAAWKAAHGQ